MAKANKNTENTNTGGVEMKAIGYVSGLYVDQKGNIVDREQQKENIKKHAKENGIEVVAMYEDVDEFQKVMDRPGIRKMISETTEAQIVLVDRVWCLGRTRAAVRPFMKALDTKGLKLETATVCFDVASQFARFWYSQKEQTYVSPRKAAGVEKRPIVPAGA